MRLPPVSPRYDFHSAESENGTSPLVDAEQSLQQAASRYLNEYGRLYEPGDTRTQRVHSKFARLVTSACIVLPRICIGEGVFAHPRCADIVGERCSVLDRLFNTWSASAPNSPYTPDINHLTPHFHQQQWLHTKFRRDTLKSQFLFPLITKTQIIHITLATWSTSQPLVARY